MTTPLRSVRVPNDLWQAATVVANRNGETISDVVRRALWEYAHPLQAVTIEQREPDGPLVVESYNAATTTGVIRRR
jgi:hypothetical protein